MHWIQRHILDQLMTHATRRFSELRAEGVESNLFQYHLRHIIRKGLVEKCDKGYRLAPQGLYYADRYSREYKGERPQPKLITVIVLKNNRGEVLLQQKSRQPWIGQYHLPAGKIHIGEATLAAAVRELKEKTGIDGVCSLQFSSSAHVQVMQEETVIGDYFGLIYSGNYDGPVERGEWIDLDRCPGGLMLAPSVKELLCLARGHDGGVHSVVVEVE